MKKLLDYSQIKPNDYKESLKKAIVMEIALQVKQCNDLVEQEIEDIAIVPDDDGVDPFDL